MSAWNHDGFGSRLLRRGFGPLLAWLWLFGLMFSLAGCSLAVMTGKMLLGDPKTPADFKVRTGVNLPKSDKLMLLVCNTPESIKSDYPSLEFDLLREVTRRLKLHGIQLVKTGDVAKFIDDNGGRWTVPELAAAFPADYIVHIDLTQYSYRNSPTLYWGYADGSVKAYEVEPRTRQTQEVYRSTFTSKYPKNQGVDVHEISPEQFRRRHLDHVSAQLARLFYDHPTVDTY